MSLLELENMENELKAYTCQERDTLVIHNCVECLDTILKCEDKVDAENENALQFYDPSTKCYEPWGA